MRTVHLTLFRGKCPRISECNTLLARNSPHTIGNSTDVLAFNFWRYKARLRPRVVPLARTKILSREIARARIGSLIQVKCEGENRIEDKTRRKTSLRNVRQHEGSRHSFFVKKGIERKRYGVGWKLGRNAPSVVRHVIGISGSVPLEFCVSV